MRVKSYFFSLVLALFAGLGCGKKDLGPTQPVEQAIVSPVATSTIEIPKEKPVYIYSGDRFRDPFTPAGQSNNYQLDAVFDPQKASLKGIVFGQGYRSAILTVGGSGSYFIKAGQIYDIMGKTVEGYSAKVFADKVTILGEADNIFELKVKNMDEEAKK